LTQEDTHDRPESVKSRMAAALRELRVLLEVNDTPR